MISRFHRVFCHLFRHRKCSDRNPVSDCLRHRHDIRFYSILLPCEHETCSAHATLDFVADHQDILLVTKCADSLHKFFCCRMNAALTLQRLQNDCTGLVIDKCFYTVQIIICRKMHRRQQRLKRLSVACSSGHGHRAYGTTMKRILHGNEFKPAVFLRICIFSGSF